MDVSTFIKEQGGTLAVAERLRIARTTVSDWKRLNSLPSNRIVQVHTTFGVPLIEVAAMTKPRAQTKRQSSVAA